MWDGLLLESITILTGRIRSHLLNQVHPRVNTRGLSPARRPKGGIVADGTIDMDEISDVEGRRAHLIGW